MNGGKILIIENLRIVMHRNARHCVDLAKAALNARSTLHHYIYLDFYVAVKFLAKFGQNQCSVWFQIKWFQITISNQFFEWWFWFQIIYTTLILISISDRFFSDFNDFAYFGNQNHLPSWFMCDIQSSFICSSQTVFILHNTSLASSAAVHGTFV